MALTDGTMLADDMAEMIADLPCTVEFGGDSFSATWSGIGRDLDVAGEGVFHKREVTLCCNVSDFTTVPEETQTIKIDDVNYYIDTRMDSPDGIAVTFVCRRV
jgi:hypothetical protein